MLLIELTYSSNKVKEKETTMLYPSLQDGSNDIK